MNQLWYFTVFTLNPLPAAALFAPSNLLLSTKKRIVILTVGKNYHLASLE